MSSICGCSLQLRCLAFALAGPSTLSQDLLKYVSDSNQAFLKELIEHDHNIQTAGHVSPCVGVCWDVWRTCESMCGRVPCGGHVSPCVGVCWDVWRTCESMCGRVLGHVEDM